MSNAQTFDPRSYKHVSICKGCQASFVSNTKAKHNSYVESKDFDCKEN